MGHNPPAAMPATGRRSSCQGDNVPAIKTMHFVVSGRVQGVWFRASTKRQADSFGLTGWVRNRPDGSVEGRARGAEGVLAEFHRWLHRGPEHARVLNVEWREGADEDFEGFSVR
jgi:acylphosphatase